MSWYLGGNNFRIPLFANIDLIIERELGSADYLQQYLALVLHLGYILIWNICIAVFIGKFIVKR